MRRALAALAAGAALLVPTGASGAATSKDAIRITTLSNRADLISGGDALVRVDLPRGARAKALRVTLGSRDVTHAFTRGRRGRVTGLVDGLALGRNVLRARLRDGRGARLTITNHPLGGPVFAGPQVKPWLCATEANGLGAPVDEQCNAPPVITYLYQPAGAEHGAYEPYDPASPPADVATTTTDAGVEVPYIVREEKGTLDRTIYKFLVLADPAKPWTGTRPQKAWNRKVFVSFAGGCGTQHVQTPPNQRSIFGESAADGQMQQPELLARGWMGIGSGLNSLNQNCNEVVSAESVMMMKERITETYGPIRRTVSAGGSGGSVQQHNIAGAYPGLLNGIVTTQSFPDLWNMVWDATECALFHRYFAAASPHLWAAPQHGSAVTGKTGPIACGQFTTFFSDAFDPQNRGLFGSGAAVRFGCELPPGETYHPQTNPTGPRCSLQDYQRAIWGHGGPRDAAPVIFDNTGVPYGLKALRDGVISAEQFVDLNSRIGAVDNEGEYTAARAAIDEVTATTMYRAGRTVDPRGLAKVPILDVRQATVDGADPDGFSDMHQPYNTHVTRARLDAVNGTHANHVMWRFPPRNMDVAAVLAVDRWLEAVDTDRSRASRAQKIIRNKPADLVDTCWIDEQPVTDAAACDAQYRVGSDPRIAAGAPLRQDNRKCRLEPLRREELGADFTADQWARLQRTFPDGVCDWTKPSVGYQRAIPWMTFAGGPGGRPLGPAPRSVATKAKGRA